jgi:tetratricopeptide (TPR) repeat protein
MIRNDGLPATARQRLCALACFLLLSLLAPVSPDEYYERGVAEYEEGNINEAIANFDRAIQSDPDRVNAFINRGLARQASGDLPGAIADYRQAIKLEPRGEVAFRQQVIELRGQTHLGQAVTDDQELAKADRRVLA